MPGSGSGRPPAIVVGRGYTGLGMLRSLVLAGIPAHVACPAGDLVTRSRWYRPTPGFSWDGGVGEQAVAALARMRLDEAVLLPGSDDVALWMADLPAALKSRFRVSSSPRESLEVLQDKARFSRLLADCGVPHPRTFPIGSESDIDAVPFDAMERVFIKPADSQAFSQGTGLKGIWAHDRGELEKTWRRYQAGGYRLMAQEYVPGDADQHYFVDGFRDASGALPGLFARRRLRIHPPDFGNSSYCESIPLEHVAEAVDALGRLFSRTAYRGIFSAEFKRDRRSGRLLLLEVNTRAWWYVEFAARQGVNVCRMAYEDARGQRVAPVPCYRTGAGCVNLLGDVKAVRARERPPPPLHVLRQWLQADFHVFRYDDPAPGGWTFLQLLRATLARLRRRWLQSDRLQASDSEC